MGRKEEYINITVPPDILEEFKRYGECKAVIIFLFVATKMKEFVEDENVLEELKSEKKLQDKALNYK